MSFKIVIIIVIILSHRIVVKIKSVSIHINACNTW